MWVQELNEDFCILVVDELDIVLIEVILFFHNVLIKFSKHFWFLKDSSAGDTRQINFF
jgi:hypothetical protein